MSRANIQNQIKRAMSRFELQDEENLPTQNAITSMTEAEKLYNIYNHNHATIDLLMVLLLLLVFHKKVRSLLLSIPHSLFDRPNSKKEIIIFPLPVSYMISISFFIITVLNSDYCDVFPRISMAFNKTVVTFFVSYIVLAFIKACHHFFEENRLLVKLIWFVILFIMTMTMSNSYNMNNLYNIDNTCTAAIYILSSIFLASISYVLFVKDKD